MTFTETITERKVTEPLKVVFLRSFFGQNQCQKHLYTMKRIHECTLCESLSYLHCENNFVCAWKLYVNSQMTAKWIRGHRF